MEQNELYQIGDAVKIHRIKEAEIIATNLALARFDVQFGERTKIIWLINFPHLGNFNLTYDFFGRVDGIVPGRQNVVTDDGAVIHKNSVAGAQLIENIDGIILLERPNGGNSRLIVQSKVYYTPIGKDDAKDLKISFKREGDRKRLFNTLDSLLLIDSKDREVIDVGDNIKLSDECHFRVNGVHDQEPGISSQRSFIRTQMEMRFQPVLDGAQEQIKRFEPFGLPLIISGGPGSGKTTTLIQRTKFLIDEVAISAYAPHIYDDIAKRNKVLADGSWVFFSPTTTLMSYLRNAMVSEGLVVSENNSMVWEQKKYNLAVDYGFIGDSEKDLFVKIPNFITDNERALRRLESQMDELILEKINSSLNKLKASTGHNRLDYLRKNVREYLNNGLEFSNVSKFMGDVLMANRQYKSELKIFQREFDLILDSKVDDVYKDISSIPDRLFHLAEMLDHPEIEKFISVNSFEQGDLEVSNPYWHIDFINEMRIPSCHWIRKFIIRLLQVNIGMRNRGSSVDAHLSSKFPEVNAVAGDSLFLSMYRGIWELEQVLDGLRKIVFRNFKSNYLKLRDKIISTDSDIFDHSEWRSIMDNKLNIYLHPDELAFLLSYINMYVSKLVTFSLQVGLDVPRHRFIEGFKRHTIPIVSVDEVTSYHPLDLKAIFSLRDPEVSSVTFAGDLMQNTSHHGINDWGIFEFIAGSVRVRDLVISYRQTSTLVDLANSIYKNETGLECNFRSQFESSVLEPWPILYINVREDQTLDWIAKSVRDIRSDYGDIKTTIAIFVNRASEVEPMVRELRLRFLNERINIANSQDGILKDADLGVFCIDEIHGVEFEAVIFHRFDELNTLFSPEIMARKLYVALTRATFYLAITAEDDLPDELGYLYECFVGHGLGTDWSILHQPLDS